jgi:DNA-binding transcriptional regulator YiaG
MMLESGRLKPFDPNALRRKNQPHAENPRLLEAAQDAGLALKMMRKAAKLTVGHLADMLGMPTEDLKKAEAGQLVERSHDGRVIDAPGALLVLVARLTDHKFIPLP